MLPIPSDTINPPPYMDFSKKRKYDNNGNETYLASAEDAFPPTNLTPDDARKIIESFTHDQLLTILQTAVVLHADVLDAVRSIADLDTTQRKLFIRGLGFDTTSDRLRTVFSLYGDVEEAVVINDRATGKSKGFGFVTFKHVDGAIFALKEPSKKIDDRIAVAQLAALGASGAITNNSMAAATSVSNRKIFVGNVPVDMSSERLLGHFSVYGEIEEGPLGFDKNTGKPKGFAFFVYKTEEGARASLVEPTKNIDGHQLACKFAVDNKKVKTGAGNTDNLIGVPNNGVSDRTGIPMPVPTSQYAPQGLYGGHSGGLHGGPPLPHHQINPNSQLPPAVVGGYSGAPFTGPIPDNYSRLNNAGSSVVGGYSGAPFSGPIPDDYSRLNNAGSSYRMPHSAGFPGSGNYGLSLSAFPAQQNYPSQGPRVPPGGEMYPGMPPYY